MRYVSDPDTMKAKEKLYMSLPKLVHVHQQQTKKVPQDALLLTLRLGYTEWAVCPDH